MYLVFQLTIDDPCNQRPSSGYRHRERALSEPPLGGDFRHFSVISVKYYPSLKPLQNSPCNFEKTCSKNGYF